MKEITKNKMNLIKEVNKNKIIKILAENNELTKFDIAKTLNISIPTVTTNVNGLKLVNIVDEVESNIYTGGRRPKIIKFNPNSRVSIGIRLSLDEVDIVILNLRKEIIFSECICINFSCFEEFMNWKSEKVVSILQKNEISINNLLGVGISIPGTINTENNIVEYTNMGIYNIDLSKFNYNYEVYYDNEANLSMLYEKDCIKDKNIKNLLYLSLNVGLGGSIIINNEIYKGSLGRAGEFGHLRFISKENDDIDKYISTSNILKIYNNRSNNIRIDSFEQFSKLVNDKDNLSLELMNIVIEKLSLCIYNLMMIFDPAMILVGGEFSELVKLYKEKLVNLIQDEVGMPYAKKIDILFSNNDKSDLIGAALLPLNDFFKLDLDNI